MDLLHVAVTSLVSLAAIFLLTKLMGNKQVSQMNLFDYVVGITIGSIAAEMATELDTPENSLLAMAVYAVAAVCISLLTNKSLRVRQLMTGKPLILMDGGTLYRKNLKIAKMDLSEFLMYCRIGGYFDLSQIQKLLLQILGSQLDRITGAVGDTGGNGLPLIGGMVGIAGADGKLGGIAAQNLGGNLG